MKKYLTISLAALLLLSLCSCNQNRSEKEAFLKDIAEAGSGVYEQEADFHHSNVISDQAVQTVDSSVPAELVVSINGSDRQLAYHDTLFYPVGETTVYRYYIDGDEDCTVLMDQDGRIQSLLYHFATLDISKTASPDEVRPLLEQKLNELVELSEYEHVNLPSAASDPNGFGIYDFLYYNMIDGYMTDYVKVSVSDDGGIFGFSIHNLASDDVQIRIDQELEEEMLNLKLNDIYTTEHTAYVSYQLAFTPQVVVYHDELHIQYPVAANYTTEDSGQMTSLVNQILIPVRLIAEGS